MACNYFFSTTNQILGGFFYSSDQSGKKYLEVSVLMALGFNADY